MTKDKEIFEINPNCTNFFHISKNFSQILRNLANRFGSEMPKPYRSYFVQYRNIGNGSNPKALIASANPFCCENFIGSLSFSKLVRFTPHHFHISMHESYYSNSRTQYSLTFIFMREIRMHNAHLRRVNVAFLCLAYIECKLFR